MPKRALTIDQAVLREGLTEGREHRGFMVVKGLPAGAELVKAKVNRQGHLVLWFAHESFAGDVSDLQVWLQTQAGEEGQTSKIALRAFMLEYVATLDDEQKEEDWLTRRARADRELEDFFRWVRARHVEEGPDDMCGAL